MQNRISYLIAGALLVMLPLSVSALDSDDPFVAETAVSDESSETRNAALGKLLATVLVRASGNTGIAGQPAARELLNAAPSLVQQYRYRTADENGKLVRYLWARFDQPVVERMMRERNLPVWAQRPRVLLWVATERGGQRVLLNLENEPQARASLQARARQRGMPLQLPLMDLEDQTSLTPADLWSDYQAGIQAASARYPHEQILVARLSARRGNKWSGSWSLIGENGSQAFQTPAQGLGDALAFGVDQAQNLIAARYAPIPGAGARSGTLVQFSDIYDLAAYGRLMTILERQEAISRIALRQVRQDSFMFELQSHGGQQDLMRALQGSGQLVIEPGPVYRAPLAATGAVADVPADAAALEAELFFRLVN